MNNGRSYDVIIVGGGLAGLSASILLVRAGKRVLLLEKETYPFHKVCGEYISLESYAFLQSLGLPVPRMGLPVISELLVSSVSGNELSQKLPLGGFGISRYRLDGDLCAIAKQNGVAVLDGTKVNDVIFADESFSVVTDRDTFTASVVCGSFGKRSNLDVKWQRPFTLRKPGALNNYIGVKYHAYLDHQRNQIALHNFSNGYCGISPVEENITCICYLTNAENLRKSGNNIRQMEEEVLFRNRCIREAFTRSRMIYDKPLTISQISFNRKEQVENHVLMMGDAAGMIAPLCGNGMSMALLASRIAVAVVDEFLNGRINRHTLETTYRTQWNAAFSRRLFAGRMIQSVFGKDGLTNATVSVLGKFPGLVSRIIRQTHG